jgi:hypothetical protein
MTKNGIWGITLVIAFVGTIVSGTFAFAAPPASSGPPTGAPGNPLEQIMATLEELQEKVIQNMMAIMGLEERVTALESGGGGAASDVVCTDCVDSSDISDGTITSADLGDSGCADGQLLSWNSDTMIWECSEDNSGSAEETDPVFGASASSGITSADIDNWNTAFSWGNHAIAGYLTSEVDPQVGSLVNGRWCSSDGITVNCTENPPGSSYTDADAIDAIESGILSSVTTLGDYNYDVPQIRTHSISAAAFNPAMADVYGVNSNWIAGNDRYLVGNAGTTGHLNADIQGIPAGAAIVRLDCHLRDKSASFDVSCRLSDTLNNLVACGTATTVGAPGDRIIVSTPCSLTLFDGRLYQVDVFHDMGCGNDCSVYGVTITYTVQKTD